jgi:hypothetical protein
MSHDNGVPGTDTLDATPTVETAAALGDLSVREDVRRTVAELGADAELDDVLAHIQSKYGLCPPRGTAQSYLSLARKDARDGLSGELRRRGRPRKVAVNGQLPPAPALDEVIDAVEILRDLSDSLGEDNLRRLLDAL